MKPSTSPCSSSSSSSCLESFTIASQTQNPKPLIKRVRKNQNKNKKSENFKIENVSSNSTRRSSIYRGVTRHRWTGRFEAHLWDKSSWNNIQNKKGRQVYLGAYDSEEAAAHTYDLAALKYWGPDTTLNFPIETYEKDIEEMEKVSKEEYLASLRRRSSGFSRGVSKFRGVARHHHNGRWEARIGRVLGNKYLYLGTYNTQEEAAAAYDMAAIEYRGANAVTNFDISNYIDQLKAKNIIIPSLEEPENQETSLTNPNVDYNANANVSSQSSEPELEKQQNQETQMQQVPPLQIYPNFSPSILDYPSEIQEHHNWNFFMDTPLPLPNIPFEKPEESANFLFDNFGFEDNIDLMFSDIEVTLTENICGNISAGGNMNQENSCLSYSPSSTTTSIFSNYSGYSG